MRLLLTGATGFVGRNLLLEAIQGGVYQEIVVPVRSLEKLRAQFHGDGFDNVPTHVRPIVSSSLDWKLKSEEPFDHVVHCAGLLFGDSKEDYFETNVAGTRRFLDGLRSPGKVIVISSQAACGPTEAEQSAKLESNEARPLTWYGESKLAMERMLTQEYSQLNYLVLRPPLVLGPRDEATLPLFKMAKQPVQFKPGMEPKYFSYISVRDLAEAVLTALQADVNWKSLSQRIFFVAASTTITDRELITGCAEAMNRKGRLVPIPHGVLKMVSRVVDAIPRARRAVPTLSRDRAREIWPNRWVVSPQKFEETFQWRAKDSLPTVLKSTHEWYRKTGRV